MALEDNCPVFCFVWPVCVCTYAHVFLFCPSLLFEMPSIYVRSTFSFFNLMVNHIIETSICFRPWCDFNELEIHIFWQQPFFCVCVSVCVLLLLVWSLCFVCKCCVVCYGQNLHLHGTHLLGPKSPALEVPNQLKPKGSTKFSAGSSTSNYMILQIANY